MVLHEIDAFKAALCGRLFVVRDEAHTTVRPDS
jgi:hypothetical protein